MVVEIRADTSRAAQPDYVEPVHDVPAADDWTDFELEETIDRRAGMRRILALAAIAFAAAWVLGMLWLARASLAQLSPLGFAQFAAALAVVPALMGIMWLIGLRTSHAEARRWSGTAAEMRAEALRLERSVAALGQAVEANRRQLATQIDDLVARGGDATERLGALGRDLSANIALANTHAATIADAADKAVAGIGTFVETLPAAHAETERVAQLLDRTAASATGHAARLEEQITGLAERGGEAERIADTAAQALAEHLARMEGTSEAAAARLEGATAAMTTTVDALLDRTADAVDRSRQGIASQGDTMLAMVGAHRTALDDAARTSAGALAERIASVEAAIERLAVRLHDQRASGETMVGELETGLQRVETQMAALHHQGVDRSQLLAASISALGGSADAMTEALRAGEEMATRTIGTTESLLIALDSAAREIDETLPDALGRLDQRVTTSKAVVATAKPELLALVSAAESSHDAIEAIAGVITEQRRVVDQLSSLLLQTLTDGQTKTESLGQVIDETIGRTHRLADEAAPRLLEALMRVRDTAQSAADKARETLATVIPEAASRLEEASASALRRATNDTVERQIAAVADATDRAVDASTRAAHRLAEQVQAIVDQTAIVETRIEDARAEREQHDSDTFSRRVSLLIESLNSASIDITRNLSTEVSDTAWAAYLKGDRGVFTRRAVRLLDAGEARAIAALYDEDAGFRERVNRYIHDFESVLRSVLAQRDGSQLGVTLLSSDMGKLYVAMAQAIERLR
jgi:hypothetical protein